MESSLPYLYPTLVLMLILCYRTPEAREALSARSCNVVLSRWTLQSLDSILGRLREADLPRAAVALGGTGKSGSRGGGGMLSVSQLSSRATLHAYRMPTMLS